MIAYGWRQEQESRMRARRRMAVLLIAAGVGMGWLLGAVAAAILRGLPV